MFRRVHIIFCCIWGWVLGHGPHHVCVCCVWCVFVRVYVRVCTVSSCSISTSCIATVLHHCSRACLHTSETTLALLCSHITSTDEFVKLAQRIALRPEINVILADNLQNVSKTLASRTARNILPDRLAFWLPSTSSNSDLPAQQEQRTSNSERHAQVED